MRKFHHVGLFVNNLNDGYEKLSSILEIETVSDIITDINLSVLVQFITDTSGLNYELVAPYGLENPVDRILRTKKNILNHVAYISDEFDSDILKLRKQGCIPLGFPKHALAFEGRRVIFFLTRLGFIYELIEGAEIVS